MVRDSVFELRQLRTFMAVAERRSFTRAAADLHIAQQAVSQQVKALERSLGVTLFRRSPRQVELTSEGVIFLADSKRILATASRAAERVRAAARGESGTLRLAYTLTTVWETLPRLLERLSEAHPQLTVQAREIFGADVPELLLSDQYDLAVAPMTSHPPGFQTRAVRREPLRVAMSDSDPLARQGSIDLATLSELRFEVWPREMAPGFYDAVVGACRAAGFEPTLDEHAAGNTVWGYLAQGRGVALINHSLSEQLPRGVALVDLAPPGATMTFEAVWRQNELAAIHRALDVAAGLAKERNWLPPPPV